MSPPLAAPMSGTPIGPPTFRALFASELLRMRSRRLFHALIAAVLVLLTIVFIVAFVQIDRSVGTVFDEEFLAGYIFAFFPPMLGLGLLVGSSHVGAEWASRGVTNLLFWEPRRVRVLAAKFCGVALATTLGSFAVLGAIGLGVRALGTTVTAEASWVVLLTARMAILIGFTALLCAATAAVSRSTITAAGGAFILLVVVEPLMYGWLDNFDRFAITANAFRFFAWETVTGQGPIAGLAILLAYIAGFVAIAMAVFKRQEIG